MATKEELVRKIELLEKNYESLTKAYDRSEASRRRLIKARNEAWEENAKLQSVVDAAYNFVDASVNLIRIRNS